MVAAICAITLLRIAATHEVFSPTWDEPLHIAAGHQFVAQGRYAMSTDNPPLARAVFAFPLRRAPAGGLGQALGAAPGRCARRAAAPPLARAVFAFPLRRAPAGEIGQGLEAAGDYMRGVVLA